MWKSLQGQGRPNIGLISVDHVTDAKPHVNKHGAARGGRWTIGSRFTSNLYYPLRRKYPSCMDMDMDILYYYSGFKFIYVNTLRSQ